MNTLPDTHVREASGCPSPVTIWQTLLTRLLDQHYGLTLNDTPFADERVIEQHIEAGISLCDAVNFLVEKYALVRTDQPGLSSTTMRIRRIQQHCCPASNRPGRMSVLFVICSFCTRTGEYHSPYFIPLTPA